MSKKKKKTQGQQFLSPEKYIKERMRTLEIGKCYFSDGLLDDKYGIVFITRIHNGGRISAARFLVDMRCKGIEDSFYDLRMDSFNYEDWKERYEDSCGLEEVSYNEAHNLLYEAVEFAEEAGIEPPKSWNLTQYFLEEDNDGIPLMNFDFGVNGQHYLMAESLTEAHKLLPLLDKHLGKGNYKYSIKAYGHVVTSDDVEENEARISQISDRWKENYQKIQKWNRPYTYKHPEYPKTLNVANKDVLELISDKKKGFDFSDKDIDGILSHDYESLKKDFENIILYEIGQTCDVPELGDYNDECLLANAMMLLAEVGDSDRSLDVVLEVLRQDNGFIEYHFGGRFEIAGLPTIAKLGKGNLEKLMSYMYETGLDNYVKRWVLEGVMLIGYYYPENLDVVYEWYSKFLDRIITDYPNIDYTDGEVNGELVHCLIELHAKDLREKMKKLYDLEIVDFIDNGDFEEADYDLMNDQALDEEFYLDIHERYKHMK